MELETKELTKRTLVNFRVPVHLRSQFDMLCEYECRSRTSVLLSLMKEFIFEQIPRVQKEIDNQQRFADSLKSLPLTRETVSLDKTPKEREIPPERFGDYVKDPVSGTWIKSAKGR